MTYKNLFTVPSYYNLFKCKGRECRQSCCVGWDVTISTKEYYKIQAMNCSSSLRKILDKTFIVKEHPNLDQFAKVQKNNKNDCPLHLDDGYCRLHKECGQNSLPFICNYYPRGIRNNYSNEASCSNSCEKTLELLIADNDKIVFEKKELNIDFPISSFLIKQEQKIHYNYLREKCFIILSDRKFSLPNRIIKMGKFLGTVIDCASYTFDYNNWVSSLQSEVEIKQDFEYSYTVQINILKHFHEQSESINKYSLEALNYYNKNTPYLQYKIGKDCLITRHENLEIMFEKLLINHLFFIQFPFAYDTKNIWEEYIAICGVYIFIRFIAIGYLHDRFLKEDFVDVISSSFRLIDHTNFTKNIYKLLKNNNIVTLKQISILLYS